MKTLIAASGSLAPESWPAVVSSLRDGRDGGRREGTSSELREPGIQGDAARDFRCGHRILARGALKTMASVPGMADAFARVARSNLWKSPFRSC